MEQIRKNYSRPEAIVDAGVLFAPILSLDQTPAQFKPTAKAGDFDEYLGYYLATADGG